MDNHRSIVKPEVNFNFLANRVIQIESNGLARRVAGRLVNLFQDP